MKLVTLSDKCTVSCLKFSLVTVFMLLMQRPQAQKNFTELDKAVEAQRSVLGKDVSVTICTADTIAFQKMYGDVTPKTIVPLKASSQWLTTALIMQLVDEGKLSLDDKVSRYLPVFELYGKGYITIRHCLTHQTGIQSEGNTLEKLFERKSFATLDDEMLVFARKEIQTNPGTEFRYSNIGINIAGRIAEVVTKKKFDLLIKQRLFTPLGMRNTSFSTGDGSAPDPSRGATSTAADYTKFLQMLLANGKAGPRQLVSEPAIAEMRKIQITIDKIKYAPKEAEGLIYALGAWSATGAESGSVLYCPGLFGTWPAVDFGRGYALLFLAKKEPDDKNKTPYPELKKLADKQFPYQ